MAPSAKVSGAAHAAPFLNLADIDMQIQLTCYRNIRLVRREAREVLTVDEDISKGEAETLIRIGGAEEYGPPKKQIPAKENKASRPAHENK